MTVILFYNARGLGAKGRKQQIGDFVLSKRVEIICLQETIKTSLSRREMRCLGGSFSYDWNVKAALGHSGGYLLLSGRICLWWSTKSRGISLLAQLFVK
jgi:hypothetical protein